MVSSYVCVLGGVGEGLSWGRRQFLSAGSLLLCILTSPCKRTKLTYVDRLINRSCMSGTVLVPPLIPSNPSNEGDKYQDYLHFILENTGPRRSCKLHQNIQLINDKNQALRPISLTIEPYS